MTPPLKPRLCAIYARYSFDSQSPSSTEDQIRRCRELAKRLGLEVDENLIFSDAEMSGYKEKQALARPQYKAMIEAWDSGRFDVLLSDELSRLARNRRQQFELYERLENERIRLVTGNGIDTAQPQWRLLAGMQGLMAQEESRMTSFRVTRGMLGQLERGYMIAQPAFGYVGERNVDATGREVGTHWRVDEANAAIIKEMYARRVRGESFAQIAKWLNHTGVMTTRGGARWRPASVSRILQNTIYRGVFVWNGSSFAKYKARKCGKAAQEQSFARPQLRIVNDAQWQAAQPTSCGRRALYGGGRNAFAGWIRCGVCNTVLSASSAGRAMACGTCQVARASGDADAPASVPSISFSAVRAMTQHVLTHVLNDACVEEVKSRLRARLAAGPSGEIERLRRLRDRARKQVESLLRLVRHSHEPDELLEAEYRDASVLLKEAERDLEAASCELSQTNRPAIEVQLTHTLDGQKIAAMLLDDKLPPEQVRAVLVRLFPDVVFVGRESSYVANFDVTFVPGAAFAWLSKTDDVDEAPVRQRVRVEGGARRPVSWQVTSALLNEVGGTMQTAGANETEACLS